MTTRSITPFMCSLDVEPQRIFSEQEIRANRELHLSLLRILHEDDLADELEAELEVDDLLSDRYFDEALKA